MPLFLHTRIALPVLALALLAAERAHPEMSVFLPLLEPRTFFP